MYIKTIVNYILDHHKKDQRFLVAIDGVSGSGKSYLAEQIKKCLPEAEILSLDIFDMYQGELSNEKVIHKILEIGTGKIVILEGIFALNNKLESYYDYKIWIECPALAGYKRGLKRDIELNGIDNTDKWENVWMPREEKYTREEKPQDKADLIIPHMSDMWV